MNFFRQFIISGITEIGVPLEIEIKNRYIFPILRYHKYFQAFTCQEVHDIAPSIFGSFLEVWHSSFEVLIPLLEQLLVSLPVQPKTKILLIYFNG